MSPDKGTSLRWLTLAVLLPLLVLGVLAWLGTRSQLKAAWTEARDEAERLAPILADELTRNLKSGMVKIPTYPDPPVPGTPSDLDKILDGSDLAALAALRDDMQAGLSPAGLPRRALAAMRLYQLDRSRQPKQDLIDLLTLEVPSILTEKAFRRYALPELERQKWIDAEKIRELAKQVRNPKGEWIFHGYSMVSFIRLTGDSVEYVTTSRQGPVDNSRSLPRWAHSHAFVGTTDWVLIASAPVGLGEGLVLGISAREHMIERPIRRQQHWTFALLTAAVALAVVALVAIHRTVLRERRINAMKSDFVASVSHELRAPVASIRLMADALSAGKIEQHTVGEFHRLISREGARLSTLIENVLDFARIEQGRKRWHFEETDLGALLTETLALMEPLAAEKNITLVSSPFPSIEANVDPGAIQQALVNLLDNAIKFSPSGSQVEIMLTENASNWEIRITDHGPGIPPPEHARIFEKFHRLGSELRRETQGTGIGLSLVKAVAEAHDGRVMLASVVGQGSSFTLIGPRTPES